MEPKPDLWRTTVHEQMGLFHKTLITIAPVAEEAHVYSDPQRSYDPWDNIAEAIYENIVITALQWGIAGQIGSEEAWCGFDRPRYPLCYPDYSDLSFIAVEPVIPAPPLLVFTDFYQIDHPFDTVRCVPQTADRKMIDEEGELLCFPFGDVRFVFQYKVSKNQWKRIEQLGILE